MPSRVHRFRGRGENHVRTRRTRQVSVAIRVTGIARQVLRSVELNRVHEERHDAQIVFGMTPPDQAQVALVESAHGWHQPDGLPRPACFFRVVLHFLWFCNHLHSEVRLGGCQR